MFVRRFFYYWQFIAVVVLPAWLMVGASVFGASGWMVLGSFFGGVILGIGLLLVALLIYARKDVRALRAVSWADVGVLALWHALVVALGFTASSAGLPLLVVAAGLAAFWFVIWEFYSAARARMREMLVVIDETARFGSMPAGGAQGSAPGSPKPPRFDSTADPAVIVIHEKPTEQ
ncbi:MFS transporter [Cryobacterium fucosi]|uniref:MFS transporter n=1 Tax=Cryobacterium fucosi TaxID=1259157 RepID=A0A4R9B1Z1_9MICO|nr:MFS transporter [Cryobacterium fucosi]TFD74375.1 MFS transporter [Cryobacterium fucosi]